jgi:hypothetical protein
VTAKAANTSAWPPLVTVAVDARWWYQGGEAVEQLQPRQDLRATASGARFRVVVADVLVIELA